MRGTIKKGRARSRSTFDVVALVLGLALIVSQALGVAAAGAATSPDDTRDRSGAFTTDTTTVTKKSSTQTPTRDRSGSLLGTTTGGSVGTSSGVQAASATGSNISVDFVAAGPKTYDHTTADGSGNLPRYDGRTISKTTGVVESLEGGDFKCGDLVVFFTKVGVSGGTGSRDVTMNLAFTKQPTGQPGAGFDDIVSASLSTKDGAAGGGNANLDGDEAVGLQNENDNAHFQGKDWVTGDVVVTNLNPGDVLVAKVVAHLGCQVGSSPTGNLQALVKDESSSVQADTFNIGSQTIPFKKIEDLAQPGLNVVKTADAGAVQAGDPIGFTITVTNDGNVALPNVTLNDPLPTGPGVSWTVAGTSGDTSGLSCSIGSNALTCTKSSLAANGSFTVHVTSQTTGDSCATYANTATVTSGQLSDSSSDSVVVQGCRVDLALSKSADADVVNEGDGLAYTIVVRNTGNGTATGVDVTDTLPSGVAIGAATFTGGSNGPGSCQISGQSVDCNVGSLASGQSATVTIHVTVDAGACPSVTNTASVSAGNETGSQDDNSDSVTVDVRCAVSVQIVKTNDANGDGEFHSTETAPSEGQDVAFEAVITNTSSVPVTITSLTDAWPGHAASDVTCDGGDPLGHTLAPGASLTCAWTEAGYAPEGGSSLTNTAVVAVSSRSGGAGDSDTSTVETPESPLGIRIVKGGPALAHVGDTIAYTFDVSLTEQTPLTDVEVTDPICTGPLTLVSKSGGDQDGWLEPGETWHYTCDHLVSGSDPDPLPNTATVTGVDKQGRQTSDTDDHLVDLIHPAIRIVKTANPLSIGPGETVTYTYRVTNVGDVTLYDVTVDDDKLGHVCDIPQLDVGETRTCSKEFTAGRDNLGPIRNVAVAEGTDETGYPVRDDDTASIDVVLGTTVTPPPTSTPPGGTAFTGSDLLPLGAVALILLVLGSGLIYLGRRREDGSQA
jgi:uncharacterized repeat protein (TIGR01451 family)